MRSVLLHYQGGLDSAPKRSWLYVWGPVLIAVTVIAIESTQTFSAENTSGWLRPLVETVFGKLSDPGWAQVHHLIRKSGHFGGFGGVCVSFVRAWLWRTLPRANWSVARWRWGAVLRAVASTAAVAGADEWHQLYLPNRTGKLSDVLLDTCGGIAACSLLWIMFWYRERTLK